MVKFTNPVWNYSLSTLEPVNLNWPYHYLERLELGTSSLSYTYSVINTHSALTRGVYLRFYSKIPIFGQMVKFLDALKITSSGHTNMPEISFISFDLLQS